MFCSGLGKAKGALLLATARQGSCFLPIVYPMAWLFDANGVAAVQAVADVLTLALAIPLIRKVLKEVKGKAAEAGQL
jgi:Na+-driven multidrug efflux pump